MAETASASIPTAAAPTTTSRKPRGANPSTDYKSLFLKSKDKYDRVSNDHTELKANVTKATAKQQKLREELDYLLDAVASKRAQRARIEQSHRDHALELEREAAAARHHASSLSSRDRDDYERYESRASAYGGEEYRSYSARYGAGEREIERDADPSYPAFASGLGGRYASPPPPAAVVGGSGSSQRYAPSEGSTQEAASRSPYAGEAYRGVASRSPPSMRRARPHDQHSLPSRYDAHQRHRESTPPLVPLAVKRPRSPSVERELLERDSAYDVDPRDREGGHYVKRPRND
ncbi:uncharacterized protein UDID_04765 [Ustilago sp. UG-2017a]|nr:uncharacterized protein UDID_04765 [Ustilago sp. UG-2017a]